MNIELTSDKPEGRAVQKNLYHGWFSKLTPERNCLKFTDKREMRTTESALKTWVRRHRPGCSVLTTVAHSSDGLPRLWLMFPELTTTRKAEPPATAWRPEQPATFTESATPTPKAKTGCPAKEVTGG